MVNAFAELRYFTPVLTDITPGSRSVTNTPIKLRKADGTLKKQSNLNTNAEAISQLHKPEPTGFETCSTRTGRQKYKACFVKQTRFIGRESQSAIRVEQHRGLQAFKPGEAELQGNRLRSRFGSNNSWRKLIGITSAETSIAGRMTGAKGDP